MNETASPVPEAGSDSFAGCHDGAVAAYQESPGQDVAADVLRRWRAAAAEGDPEQFARRLRWLGVSPEEALAYSARRARDADVEGARWAPTLRAILGLPAEAGTDEGVGGFLDAERPLPFEDVLAPIVRLARLLLDRTLAPADRALFAPPAWAALERLLLERLVDIAADALFAELDQARPIGQRLLGHFAGAADVADEAGSGRAHYLRFARALAEHGLADLFATYRALGPVVAGLVDDWVGASAALARHLSEDLPVLQARFGIAVSGPAALADRDRLSVVAAIRPGLSDPHHGGRSVAVLIFADGTRLVYKPRSLGMEAAYAELLAWCNRAGAPLDVKAAAALDRDDHGWMEYVAAEPCADLPAARRFYVRTGSLLCLLYILGGSDWHADNVIAAGEHPIVVDLETLFQPGDRVRADGTRAGAEWLRPADAFFWSSVMRTGFLPRWELGADGTMAYDLSALGSYGDQPSPWSVRTWVAVNTDAMRPAWTDGAIPSGQNVPSLDGAQLEPGEYLGEIADGFESMYRFLLRHRTTLTGPSSPLNRFAHLPLRFIVRDTELYYAVRRRSLSPVALRSELDRDLALELLARAHLAEPEQRGAPEILRAEIAAVRRLDVPYFTVPSARSTALEADGSMVDRAFDGSALDRASATLHSLSEVDLARQLGLIRGAMAARAARVGLAHDPGPPGDRAPLGAAPDLSAARLRAEARRLADDHAAAALHGPDGAPGWIGLRLLAGADRFQLAPLGETLYDGVCGLALFFAALASVDGDGQAATFALDALRPLRDTLRRPDDRSSVAALAELGVGGVAGLNSLVYALTRIAGLLGEPALLDDARVVARLIGPELIATDRAFDVVSGAAGAVLALLVLDRAGADPSALERAAACGRHLLEHRSAGAGQAWTSEDEDRPLTGFSHGAAGIAYALARLHEATGRRCFLDAARDAIAYERSLFSDARANWPDLRRSTAGQDPPRFGLGWCHGAPGIALGRLGCLDVLDEPRLHDEIDVALRTTEAAGLGEVDQLCCGNLGRAEVLLTAGVRLGERRWQAAARRLAARVVERASRAGRYRVHPSLDDHLLIPGLFQGVAGIGYGLLRLAYPDRLPNVLLLE